MTASTPPAGATGDPARTTTPMKEDRRMSRFVSVTPNLFVTDMTRAVAFYRDVLGFAIKLTVPDEAPHVFAWMTHGDVTVFLNDLATVQHDLSEAAAPRPGSAALFITVEGVDALHDQVTPHARRVQPLTNQFYGMREFSILDPDGYVVTFAERIGG